MSDTGISGTGIVDTEHKALTPTGKFVLCVAMFVTTLLMMVIIDIMSPSSNADLPNDMMGKCQVSYLSTSMLPETGREYDADSESVSKNIYAVTMPDGQVVEGYGVHGTYVPLDGEYEFTGVLRSDGGYNITIDSSYIPNAEEDIHETSRADWDDDVPSVSQVISDFIWMPSEEFLAGMNAVGEEEEERQQAEDSGTDKKAVSVDNVDDSDDEVDTSDMGIDDKLAINLPTDSSNTMKVDGYAVDAVTAAHEGCAREGAAIDVTINYENLFAEHPVTVIAVLVDTSTNEVIKNSDGIEVISARDFTTARHEDVISTASDDKLLDEFCALLLSVADEAHADSDAKMPSSEALQLIINDAKQNGAAKLIEMKEPIEHIYRYAYDNALPVSESLPPLQQIADACERVHIAGIYATLGDGELTMRVPVEPESIKGKVVAVQVELSTEGNVIAQLPLDLSDADYRISYPSIETEATVRGSHEAKAEPGTVIVDTIKYSNLVPGKQYHVKSTVIDNESSSAVLDQKTKDEVTYITEFVPEKSSGIFNVIFPEFDSTSMRGRTALVREEIYECQMLERGSNMPAETTHSSKTEVLVAITEESENPLIEIEFNQEISLAETGAELEMGLPSTGGVLLFAAIGAVIAISLVIFVFVRVRRK